MDGPLCCWNKVENAREVCRVFVEALLVINQS